jgi:hypothetical protein
VLALHDDLLIVADSIAGAGRHAAAVHWHVDPRWDVRVQGRRAMFLSDGARVELVATLPLEAIAADVESGLGWHSPVYGRVEPSTTLRLAQTGTTPLWIFSIFGLDADNPIVDVDLLPVWAEAGVLAQSTAIRITRTHSIDHFAVADAASEGAPTWRVGELETNARMLFVRTVHDSHVTRVALVDGSVARTGRRGVQLQLPDSAPDLHLEIVRRPDRSGPVVARLTGPASTARLVVSGREQPVAIERRALPRRRVQQ